MGAHRGDELQSHLIKLVRSSPVIMRVLRAARSVDAPDWLIGGAVIREHVWAHLHGFVRAAPCRDVDLAFFHPASHPDAHPRRARTGPRRLEGPPSQRVI